MNKDYFDNTMKWVYFILSSIILWAIVMIVILFVDSDINFIDLVGSICFAIVGGGLVVIIIQTYTDEIAAQHWFQGKVIKKEKEYYKVKGGGYYVFYIIVKTTDNVEMKLIGHDGEFVCMNYDTLLDILIRENRIIEFKLLDETVIDNQG